MTVDQIPIGRFSLATQLSVKALRYYDEKGILVPEAKDTITGYRYYTGAQIADAVRIRALTSLGFNLDETVEILEDIATGDRVTVEELLRERLVSTRREIAQLEKVANMLESKTDAMIGMTLTVPVVKNVPSMRVLSKREKGSYGTTIGKLIGELMVCLNSPENREAFVKMVGPIMAIYHDEEYKENDADLEVAIPIVGRVTVTDPGMEIRNLPSARVVSLVHKGPYETIHCAYARLAEYAAANNLSYAGPMMDIYLSDPNNVPRDEIMTEVQAPLAN